ncbi:MAG: chemotaxis protein CheA [Nitrospirae bacterium]|nr:chemotaxis protein CheA [Nitrospirota bacterium]
MDLTSAQQTFLVEVVEVLQDMENILLTIESSPGDRDKINALFRSAHTIKGSAGMIGLEEVERFTHKVESVLDRLRIDEIHVSRDMVDLLLRCKDHVKELVEYSFSGNPMDELQLVGNELSLSLAKYMRHDVSHAKSPGKPDNVSQATGAAVGPDKYSGSTGNPGSSTGDVNAPSGTPATWHISLRFGKNLLKDGMDPISTIGYLSKLGQVVNLVTIDEAMPGAAQMDPEDCYLGFEIDLDSSCDKKTIEDVFEFVMEDSKIVVIPPHSPVETFDKTIDELPEDVSKLGEILVRGGLVTRRDIGDALAIQMAEIKGSGNKPLIGEILVHKGVLGKEIVDIALDKQQQVRECLSGMASHTVSNTIRVDAEKLDMLINIVGELVVANGGMKQLALKSKDTELTKSASFMTKLVNDIRDMSMKMRMVPIGTSFNRFQRMVHDLSKELGKEIDLVITGADTELDKTMAEKINDPLTHLVRNAVDHGIEQPHERSAGGKPAKATVKLNSYYDAGVIVIEVTDDGKGLNRERIMEKAISQGLASQDKTLSDRELLNLIFEPGFSTAKEVTKLSGRGVGMDVVKRNIEALRGFVTLESEEGKGTTVKIHLPLTLSIIEGFMVGIGKARYIIPLDMVIKCFSISGEEYHKISDQCYFTFHGKVIPFVSLWDLFGTTGLKEYCGNIVIVQYAGRQLAMAVDKLFGDVQAVIKSLGKIYKDLKGVSGATILGDGTVALILDVPGILKIMEGKQV